MHGKVRYTFTNGDLLTGNCEKGKLTGEVCVILKDSGKEQTFLWPETDTSTIEGQAHAARDHAMSLLSELNLLYFSYKIKQCFSL